MICVVVAVALLVCQATTVHGGACENKEPVKDCYAGTNMGNCENSAYKNWLEINCRRFCKFCEWSRQPVEDKNCEDTGTTCQMIVKANRCDIEMSAGGKTIGEYICRKSCGICKLPEDNNEEEEDEEENKEPVVDEDCKDKLKTCEKIVNANGCNNVLSSGKTVGEFGCRLSCGICKLPEDDDQEEEEEACVDKKKICKKVNADKCANKKFKKKCPCACKAALQN